MMGRARRLRLAWWRISHRGTARRCPLCATEVRQFAPYGVSQRADAQCPGCGSLERHRALWMYLDRATTFTRRPLRVLAVAPDPFLERAGRRLHPDYLSIDIDAGRAMRVMDLVSLDLPDDDRDLVIAYHVLEHIVEDRTAMREIARVLRPDGLALIEVPLRGDTTDERHMHADPTVRAHHYGQHDHVRLYGHADLLERLRSSGLEAEPVLVREAFADSMEVAALDPGEVFFVARRRP